MSFIKNMSVEAKKWVMLELTLLTCIGALYFVVREAKAFQDPTVLLGFIISIMTIANGGTAVHHFSPKMFTWFSDMKAAKEDDKPEENK